MGGGREALLGEGFLGFGFYYARGGRKRREWVPCLNEEGEVATK